MEYEQWLGILTSINADNNLNESNVIEKIKEKLEKEDPGTYQEWQNNQFDINYTFADQRTLLHIAAENGFVKVTKLLITKGADVDKTGQYGWAPLHCAAADGRTEIVKVLIEKGAIVNAVGEDNWTPLYLAVENGHTETVNALIEEGANVNVLSESDKVTPLHLAVHSDHAETVKALMKKGADPLLENKSYRTLKRLTELIKNDSLEHPSEKKRGSTTERGTSG